MSLERVERLFSLLGRRNSIDAEITAIIGRPAEKGHIGEFLAAELFGVALHASATHAGSDGVFRGGPHAGRTVNVKWYGKREGLLDLATKQMPDFYLVLAGPKAAGATSRGGHRPLLIESVYLFESGPLHEALAGRGLKLGTATSVCRGLWDAAEIWPRPNPGLLAVDPPVGAVLKRLVAEGGAS